LLTVYCDGGNDGNFVSFGRLRLTVFFKIVLRENMLRVWNKACVCCCSVSVQAV